jgi:hypothetical protein
MATKDLKNNVKFVGSLAPQALTAAADGTGVDVSDFESVTLIAYGDGTLVGKVELEESDSSGSGYTAVAAADCIGTNNSDVDATDTVITIGYIGQKQYVRAAWSTHTTNGDGAAVFALGHPAVAPVTGNDN